MRAVTDGRIELSSEIERHLELCLDCRSCETACPSGVQYGRMIEPFRTEMASDQPHSPGWFERRILHGLFPYPRKLRRSLALARWMQRFKLDRIAEILGVISLLPRKLRRMHRLLPRLEAPTPALPESLPPAPGVPRRARVGLFTGCVADAMFRSMHWATIHVLRANGCEVVIPPASVHGQACCGAIHYHSGAGDPAIDFALANVTAFPSDLDAVLVNVAGCGAMLKDYGHIAQELRPHDSVLQKRLAAFAGKVRDVSEFLAELGPLPPSEPVPIKATYHDACHLCHAQQIRSQPRQLLEQIPELDLLPLTESEICCGAAGSYNLTEPEMADRLGRRKVRHILATGAEAVITANAGCSLQIQAMLREAGHPLPVYHPMDLLARSYGMNEAGNKSPR